MKTDIQTAIKSINPSAEVTVNAEDFEQITWHKGDVISKEDIQAKQAELDTAYDTKQAKLATDKASAKTKLMAGEPLTEDEADTIVL